MTGGDFGWRKEDGVSSLRSEKMFRSGARDWLERERERTRWDVRSGEAIGLRGREVKWEMGNGEVGRMEETF